MSLLNSYSPFQIVLFWSSHFISKATSSHLRSTQIAYMRMQFEYINKNAGGKFPISSTQARAKDDGHDKSLGQTARSAQRMGAGQYRYNRNRNNVRQQYDPFSKCLLYPLFQWHTHLKYAMMNVNRIMLWWFNKAAQTFSLKKSPLPIERSIGEAFEAYRSPFSSNS